MLKDKNYFMKRAFMQAVSARENDEVPIGAIIVKDDKIIAKASNCREKTQVATFHAEVIAINKACKKLGSWRLDDCEMYVTLEPCVMCAGAILNARLKKVYFGAYEKKGGAVESVYHLLDKSGLNWSVEYEGGVLEEDCSRLISDFFRNKRG